jgi:hypothetical protein
MKRYKPCYFRKEGECITVVPGNLEEIREKEGTEIIASLVGAGAIPINENGDEECPISHAEMIGKLNKLGKCKGGL